MNERGQTLIEVLIGVILLAVVILGLLQGLSVGVWGTINVSQRSTALNLARSQLEYIKSQPYDGEEPFEYDIIPDVPAGFQVEISDVAELTEDALQQVTITVTYLQGKSVGFVGYKAARSGDVYKEPRDLIVTEYIDVPPLPEGGFWFLGDYYGYYYVFETGSTGAVSATWIFQSDESGWSPGYTFVSIYEGKPSWTGEGDEGIITKSGSFWPPGGYPPSGYIVRERESRSHDVEGTYIVPCTAGDQPANTYTVLFFNGEWDDDIFTISASVSYKW